MNKAIFLDRDGVINREDGYVYHIEDFIILDGVIESLTELRDKGYVFVIITNQGGIATGLYGHGEVQIIHDHLRSIFAENDIEITAIYYCPHRTNHGKCLCRKPDSGMIERAAARYNIDISQSYMIGDFDRDVEAGEKAGVKKAIKIVSNGDIREILSLID